MMPLVIAGPTASGKSSLAMRLAKKFSGEIICADSRQIYRGMTIGTACPSEEDMKVVPHHGYGLFDPKSEKMDAGYFVKFAHEKIQEVTARGHRPILVGGTGLYLRALYYGMTDVPQSNKDVLSEIVNRCEQVGLGKLYEELKRIDPDGARIIRPEDRYRIVRALEIYSITRKPPSQLRKSFMSAKPKIDAHFVYKKPAKATLLKQIERRVQDMFREGLVDEAKKLRDSLSGSHWALSVMGYQEALAVLDNELTINQAIERTTIRHRQYAKRQYTWFNKERFYRFVIQS